MTDQHDNFDEDVRMDGADARSDSGARERSSAGSPADASAGSPGEFPPLAGSELADLVRDLERIGAMRRSQLSSSVEDRIFAASDLHLPIAGGRPAPVVARIGPVDGRSGRRWLRVAAAIAAVASITAGAIILTRGVDSSGGGDAPMPGPGRVIAEGPASDASDDASRGSESRSQTEPRLMEPAAEHFELALAVLPSDRASSMSSGTVAAALATPRRLAYTPIARDSGAAVPFASPVASPFASPFASPVAIASTASGTGRASVAGSARSLEGDDADRFGGGSDDLQDALDLDFDGLSGEFAAIVSHSAGIR
jgi:hypothetical protein